MKSNALKNATDTKSIISRYMSELGKKGQANRQHITKEQLSKWGSKGRAFLNNMTPEEKHEYFRRVRAGEKVG